MSGTATANTVRTVGNLLGGGGGWGQAQMTAIGGGLGLLGGGGGASVGLGAAAVFLAGTGMRSIYNAMTKRQIKRLDAMVRSRSPLYEKMKAEAEKVVTERNIPNAPAVIPGLARAMLVDFMMKPPGTRAPGHTPRPRFRPSWEREMDDLMETGA